jgi:hypothetical protein
MIYLNREIESIFNVDQDLVIDYKRVCDRYLVNIRRNLSKQLVFYKVYYDLQQVNNSYFEIIDKLINELYEYVADLDKDYSVFIRNCNTFLKNSENIIPQNIHYLVDSDIKSIQLSLDKLIYIIKNFCDDSEDNF